MALPRKDFYEVQKERRIKSLFLFSVLVLFYFLAVGLVALALALGLGLFLTTPLLTGRFLVRLLVVDLAVSVAVAYFHFKDARRFGAAYILKRLQASPPDPGDRYHKQFINTVEEMRISAGLPDVRPYVIPALAINSMALIEADGTPAVAMTEGLLAESTRDELEAVAAHELAHVARGDAFYITLVCSLANLFEKIRDALEPERPEPGGIGAGGWSGRGSEASALPVPAYLAVSFSLVILRLLSTLISRERELLADAAAVEFCRAPVPLARAIYRAHVKNSFVGDFALTYTPLFIVPPYSRDIGEGFWSRLFNTHPPILKRVRLLAGMAGKSTSEIISEVQDIERARDRARTVAPSIDELRGGGKGSGPGPESPDETEGKAWLLRSEGGGSLGPLTTAELLGHPQFTLLAVVRSLQENVEAKAREFPQIRAALRSACRRPSSSTPSLNRCPRCRLPLSETYYEGVLLRICQGCRGRWVDMSSMDRIIARREAGFSNGMIRKAEEFRDKMVLNPLKKLKLNDKVPEAGLTCPGCGRKMVARPYNYQYFIPVDKCLGCEKIWFDADELELLQALIENR